MLISPQLDANGYPLENDNYDNYTQSINIATSLNFDISDNLDQGITYEDLTSNKPFKASERDDQRLLIASDKFNLAPGQSVNFGIAQIFGNALSDGTIVKASGDESELEEILNKWQALYDKIYIDELKVQTTSIPVNDKHEAICYPNPSNGIVNISESVRDNTIIEIFDVFGTRILRNEGKTSSLDLTNFENGTYIISIKEGNNTKYDKIILQK